MKTICLVDLFVILIFMACSSTHLLIPKQFAYAALNEELQAERGEILLKNKAVIFGENIIIGTDSTSWTSLTALKDNRQEQMEHCVSTAEIQKIVFKNNTKGMWEGFGFGALGGLMTLVIASTQWEDDAKGYGPGPSAAPYILAGVAVAGGLIGAPFGALIGHTEKHIFHQYINIEVLSVKDQSKNIVRFEWNGKIIDIPRSKLEHIERFEDKTIITIPLKFYKQYLAQKADI